MKRIAYIYMGLFVFLMAFSACDENDPGPSYDIVGRSYVTQASISVSNDEPDPGETITVTVTYLNYNEDPAQSITLIADRSGATSTVGTTDESGAGTGEISRSFQYTAPADAAGESIDLTAELRSELEFPLVLQASIDVNED